MLQINDDLNDFHTRTSKFLNRTTSLYKEYVNLGFVFIWDRVQQLNKQLLLDFDQLSSTLFEIGNVFSELYSASLDYSTSVNTNKFQSLNDIYVNMNNFMVSWG